MNLLRKHLRLILMLLVATQLTFSTKTEEKGVIASVSSVASNANTNINSGFNPNSIRASVSVNSSGVKINTTFNPNSISANASISFNPNSIIPQGNFTQNHHLQNVSNSSGCFFDTIGSVIASLQNSVNYYTNLCALQNKTQVSRLITVSRIIGIVEGYRGIPITQIPSSLYSLTATLRQYSDFKFYTYLIQIEASLKAGKDITELFKNLWSAVGDELDVIIRTNNYPFFFRGSIWNLIQSERALNFLKEQYVGRENQCVPNNWEDILQYSDLTRDQNFARIFKPVGGKCKRDAFDISIASNAFENGGIVITFWGSENLIQMKNNIVTPLVGYINNNKIYEYNLIPDKFRVIHQLKVLDRFINIESNSHCANYFFAVLAIQKDCDKYVLHYSVRFLASNTAKRGSFSLTPDRVENLHLIFDKNLTFSNEYYKNVKYTPETDLLLMAYSLNSASWKTILERARCAPNCEYSEGSNCLSCKAPTLRHNGVCVSSCPSATFPNNGTCSPCNENCNNCTGPLNGNCKDCKYSLFFTKGKCDVRCPEYLAADNNKICQPCGNDCAACKDTKTCGKCTPTTFLKDGQCLPTCPAKTFKTFNPNVCQPCPNGCHTCDTADKCTSCSDGFFLKHNQCVTSCGDEYWADKATNTCKPCEKNCKACKDSVTCTQCNKGFHFHNADCKSNCPVGTVSVNGVCVDCKNKHCEVCSSTNVAECKVCDSKTFLKNNECVENCGTGFYADANKHCQHCPTDCNVCTKDKCLQCNNNKFVLKDNTCVTTCPDGFIPSGNVCVQCTTPNDCKKCLNNNLDSCTLCYSDRKNKYLLNGKCLNTCPVGYFARNNDCVKCINGCDVCKNELNCENCNIKFFWENHLCKDKCSAGFAAIGSNRCQPCVVGDCHECSKNINTCEKCNSKSPILYNNKCITKCPVGTYQKDTTCDSCDGDCLECSNKFTCHKCKPGKVLQGTTCVSVCNDNFVAINGVCIKCKNPNCRKCLATDTSKCTECPSNLNLHKGDCVNGCPDKTYPRSGECKDCVKPCNKCKSEKECVDCVEKFSLHGMSCTDNCPENFISISQKCQKCHDANCSKCKDVVADSCIACKKDFALFNGRCVATCPENYYKADQICRPCLSNCKKCNNDKQCTECIGKFYLKENNQCVSDCGQGYTIVGNVCRKCHPTCATCKSSNINECTSCHHDYLLHSSECVTKCPEGTFKTEKKTCENCSVNHCRVCEGGKTCTDCNTNYVLENNVCRNPPCSEGWVLKPKSSKCIKCEVFNCKECPNTNLKICDSCIGNNFLIDNNRCEKDCIAGTFKNLVTKKCQSCSKNCLTCTDDLHCSQCENNYYLFGNKCQQFCPSGYSKTNGKCLPCAVKNCDVCPTNSVCEKCSHSHVLQDGACETHCKKGYFNKDGNCKKCPLYCNDCENENKCRVCQAGKVLNVDDKCIDDCPSGSIAVSGKCVKCQSDKNCDKCKPDNLKECLGCNGNLALKANTCVENCGDNFYINAKKCSKCGTNCKKCIDGNKCLECDSGAALHKDECVVTCPTSYRKENGKCVPCSVNCDHCDATKCIVCTPKTFLQNGKCVKTCSEEYYLSQGTTCLPCGTGCKTCFTENTCEVCRNPLLIQDGKCVPTCNQGRVAVNGKCEKCGKGCLSCNPANVKECKLCQNGHPLHEGNCVESCPAKFYLNNNVCHPCLKGCDVCTNDKSCSKCSPPLYLSVDQKRCLENCPAGQRQSSGVCTPCEDKLCLKCGSATNICEVCNTPNLLHSKICTPTCPVGYYISSDKVRCSKCDPSCTKCSSQKVCSECARGFTLQDDQCVNSCKEGFVNINQVCKNCLTTSCEICKVDQKTCEKCTKGKVLFTVTEKSLLRFRMSNVTVNNRTNITTNIVSAHSNSTVITNNTNFTIGINSTLCLDSCPLGYFESKGICLPCGDDCNKCTNAQQCLVCAPGNVLQSGKCQKRCNKYSVEFNGECVKCNDPKCVNCDSLTRKVCTVCDENNVLLQGECKSDCGPSYFKYSVSKDVHICSPCGFKCENCHNNVTCENCLQGSFLKNGQCVQDCGRGFVVKGKKCVECTSKKCVACDPNNVNNCITCSTETRLKNGLCVANCGERYFSSDKGICLNCTDPSCITCSPQNNCTQCDKGKVIFKGQCKNNCPSGYTANPLTNICQACLDMNCDICNPTNSTQCSKCKNGYLLQPNFSCDPKCPPKYFKHLNERCLPCANYCDICTSDTNCVTCQTKYVLDQNNMCSDKCPTGQVEVKGKCEKCVDKKCSQCNSTNKTICEICLPGTFLYHGKCHDKCPNSTFPLGTKCVDCNKNCTDCISESKCTNCKSGWYLLDHLCLDKCPEGYRAAPGECVKCANFEKTKSCDRNNVPIQCRDKFYMNNICVDVCPDGTYPDTNRRCQTCDKECVKCASTTQCKKCNTKTKLHQGKCINSCPSGTVDILGECTSCKNPNCHECTPSDLNKCIDCKEKFLLYGFECLSACPTGTYAKGKVCEKCDASCADCKNANTCERCINQFALHEGKCVQKCPTGYVQRNGQCFACSDKKCGICNGNDLNQCLSCRQGYLLNNICYENCPITFRNDNSTNTCQPCSKYCDHCTAKGCNNCTKSFYFSESDPNFCVPCTDSDLVIVGKRCERCKVTGCKKCETAKTDVCVLCDSKKVLHLGKCHDSCPIGFFQTGLTCSPCGKDCKICTNDKNCEECHSPNVVFNGACIPKCPSSYTKRNGKCVPCAQTECEVCDSSNTATCFTCKNAFLYKQQCYKACPTGTYPDGAVCKECPNGCSQCTINKCEGCTHGLKLRGSECVKECGKGYFDSGARCEKCIDDKCENCSPSNICKKCTGNYFLDLNTHTCVASCKPGFFTNKTTGSCDKCESGCSVCKESKHCETCEKGLMLHNGYCVQNCPDGYSPTAAICKPCQDSKCAKCPNKVEECEDCTKSFLFQKKCVPSCPAGTFLKDGRCRTCDKKCDTCKNKLSCSKCKSEFDLKDGRCVEKCSEGKVEINGKCISCADKNCKACLRDTSICVECLNNFLLYDNTCKTQCPAGFYIKGKECSTCSNGCTQCTDKSTCKKCHPGYFLHKNACVRECPKGMWGNCKDDTCYNCLEACEDCVDGSATNCPLCAKGFYKDENTCVKATACRKGTFANDGDRSCTPCRIPFCSACSNQTTCKSCVRGYELNNKGVCTESKTFVSVIGQNPRLFSSETLKLYRSTETKSFDKDLKGTGIDSENLSFTFWIRRISDSHYSTRVFETQSKATAMNTRFEISPVNGVDTCRLIVNQDSTLNVLNLGNCSFAALYNWNFISVNLYRVGEKAHAEVRITNSKGDIRQRTLDFPIGKTISWITKDSTLVFNDNTNKGDIVPSAAFELANFNVMDYDATPQDLLEYSLLKPNNCDYNCVDCKGICLKCQGDVPAGSDGLCSASFVSIKHDFQRLANLTSVHFRSKITNRLDSERYGLMMWFNTENYTNTTDIANIYYNYPSADNIITVRIIDKRLVFFVSNETHNVFPNVYIQPLEWYFIGAIVNGQSLQIYLRNNNGLNEMKVISLKTLPSRLTEDAIFTTGPNRIIAARTTFSGSLYDTRFYTNNVPTIDQINNHFGGLPCPKHCVQCSKMLTCEKCSANYQVKDGLCSDVKIIKPVHILDKYSFVSPNTTVVLNIPPTFNTSQFTVNFFYRKKIHTYASPAVDILRYEGEDGKVQKLISEIVFNNYQSDFQVYNLNNSTSSLFKHDFSDEIYSYIHFALEIDMTKKTINLIAYDGNEHTFTVSINSRIKKFILGDSFQLVTTNYEIGMFTLYDQLIGKNEIVRLRAKAPKDCNPGCQQCDYHSGLCKACLNQQGTNFTTCNNVLRGYSNAHIYNIQILDKKLADQYSNSLSGVFTKDVNSEEYSVVGYFRLFDLKILKEYKTGRFEVFRVSNTIKHSLNNNSLPSSNLLGLEIFNNNGQANYYITYRDGNAGGSSLVKGLEVNTNWMLILATVNVREKTIKYAIQYQNSNQQTYQETIKLARYPDRLTETGTLTLFGVGIGLPSNYHVLNAQFYRFYLGPNLKFDLSILEKFKKQLPIPQEPTCPANCERCIVTESKVIDCLACSKGFELENEQCYKSDSKYVVLADQNTYTYLPPSTDLALPSTVSLFPKNTITFYLRRNYLSATPLDAVIFKGGNVNIKLNSDAKGQASLIVSVEKHPSSLLFSIDENSNEDYNWYLVIINYSANTLDVVLKNEKVNLKKGFKTEGTNKIAIPSISFNSLGNQVSIYAPNIILRNFYEIDFVKPSTFCELECDVCIQGKCAECQWGMEKDGSCVKNPISIPVFSVGAGSKFQNKYDLKTYLNNPKPLRSRNWSIIFTFELKALFNSYNGKSLFSLLSEENGIQLFNINFNSANSFFVTLKNRHYSQQGPSFGVPTNSFKQTPVNKIYAVGIAFNDDKNEITLHVYNSPENYIKQKIPYAGRAENLNLKSILSFGGNLGNSTNTIIYEHIHFYFDNSISEETITKFYEKRHTSYQKACLNNTRIACEGCKNGAFNVGGVCAPVNKIYSSWVNKVRHVTNFNSESANAKYFFTNNSTKFTNSFWFKLYSYTDNPFGVIKFSLVDGRNTSEIIRIRYDSNNFYVDVFDQGRNQVNGIKYDNVITAANGYTWTYVSVAVDVATNTLSLYTYDAKMKKSRILTNVGKARYNMVLNTNKYLFATAGYETTFKGAGYHFEISSLVFSPGWFPKDSTELELYRIRTPRQCNYRCLSECDSQNICPANSILLKDINAGNIYIGTPQLKGKVDIVSLGSIKLFRQLIDLLPETEGTPVYNDFLVSIEFDVPNILTSTYKANANTLFAVTNSPNQKYTTLNMNDLVPSDAIQYGVLGAEITSEGFKFWIGSSKFGNTISFYNFQLQSLKGTSKVTLEIYIDSTHKRARIIAYIDDLRTFYDINSTFPLEPISSSTLVYTHPAVTGLRFNVNNPRFLYEDTNYYIGKAQDTTTYPSKKCGTNCSKCTYVPSKQLFTCDRCDKGYMLINNGCMKSNL